MTTAPSLANLAASAAETQLAARPAAARLPPTLQLVVVVGCRLPDRWRLRSMPLVKPMPWMIGHMWTFAKEPMYLLYVSAPLCASKLRQPRGRAFAQLACLRLSAARCAHEPAH